MSRRSDSPEGVTLTAYHARNKNDTHISPKSRRTGQYTMNHGNGNSNLDKVSFNRSGSQDSLDELSLDDYWTEVEDIKKSSDNSQKKEDVVVKEPAEGELEEEWLKRAGLSVPCGDGSADSQESMVLLSTLTKTQSAAVQKRMDTFQQTLRKKNKHHQVPDVRDVFKQPAVSKDQDEGLSELQPAKTNEVTEEESQEKSEGSITDQDAKGQTSRTEDVPLPETDINLEISFAEQASKVKEFPTVRNEKDDDSLLPNYRLPQDKTGITKIGDLAPQDMKKVTSLALIELTALYEVLGTEIKFPRAAKGRVRETGIFRVPLSVLLEQDQKKVPGTKVPLFLQSLIGFIEKVGLDTEGILRKSGVSSRVKALCHELEAKFYEGTFNWDTVKQHDAASLLKFFIRELPLPLLTVEYMNAFHSVQYLPTKKHRLQALNLLFVLLPDIHRDTLKALLEFLQRVVDHKEQNKMTLKNVAMIMAPNLFTDLTFFLLKGVDQGAMTGAAKTASVMLFMIKYQKLLCTIPKFLVAQVRQQNILSQKKNVKEKAKKKLLKMMAYDREKSEKSLADNDKAQGVIRVQASLFSKVSMAIQLTEDLKAGDILARFLNQESGSSMTLTSEEVSLYEIGGNIGERCLEDTTYMKDLYQLNPHAEWVIKLKPKE